MSRLSRNRCVDREASGTSTTFPMILIEVDARATLGTSDLPIRSSKRADQKIGVLKLNLHCSSELQSPPKSGYNDTTDRASDLIQSVLKSENANESKPISGDGS